MKLDDTVCRGSLILCGAHRYVVVGVTKDKDRRGQENKMEVWKVIPVEFITEGRVAGFNRFLKDEEVDMFFPGEAYPLPDYIK